MSSLVPRVGGRVLVIDPDGRLLLIHERIENGSTQWVAPGGGVEAGETPREAAVRELAEETGIEISLPPDAEAVLVTRGQWSWGGTTYDQVDHFFVATVTAGLHASPRQLTAVETETILGYRWWSAAELQVIDDVLEPDELADVLGRVAGDTVPSDSAACG